MPSIEHEAIIALFQSRPRLAAELIELVTGRPLPDFDTAELSDAALAEQLALERRADAVIVLLKLVPVLAIVLERQQQPDESKRRTWPLVTARVGALMKCPVVLLVICRDRATARWAQGMMEKIQADRWSLVVGPDAVPRLEALPPERRSAGMAVLSVEAHGREPGAATLARAALETVAGLPWEQSMVYWDAIWAVLDADTRRELEELMQQGQYEYRSEFALRYFGQGREEGRKEGQLEAQRAVAAKLLARGTQVAEVAELTGLTEEQVRALQH